VNLWWKANLFRRRGGNYLSYKKEDKIYLITFRLIVAVSSAVFMEEL
jgi:hypothetical protein